MQGDTDFRFSPRPNRAAEIEWRPWGEPAFAEARRLGRPILLSLSAVWCHWCHVMDETSYSDARVIARINEAYVPIRADNDRNPDVNRRYNMGGWPTTAFLAARYRAASTSGETAPALEALEEEQERISSSRRGIQSEAAASATIAPGALQIEAGKDKAAAGFCC